MLNRIIKDILNMPDELIILSLSILVILFKVYCPPNIILYNILLLTLAISVFEVFIKKFVLFKVKNEFHKFVMNNVISIVIINFIMYMFNNDLNKNNIINLLYIAISCLFYELIIYKLHSYNDYCNSRLRSLAKTTMRLTTIHIMTTYLQNGNFDELWYIESVSQLASILLMNTIFTNQ